MGGEHVGDVVEREVFLLEAVLQFHLRMGGEAIAKPEVHAPHVAPPGDEVVEFGADVAEELLVPAEGAEELRGEFVFKA